MTSDLWRDTAGGASQTRENLAEHNPMTRRIIDGKRYDTETADLIAETSASCACEDFHWWKEALYRTTNGRFFLKGTGGPMTRWARKVDQNSYCGGDGLRAVTDGEARHWVERYANEKYSELFSVEAA